jgi:hypothetical protein
MRSSRKTVFFPIKNEQKRICFWFRKSQVNDTKSKMTHRKKIIESLKGKYHGPVHGIATFTVYVVGYMGIHVHVYIHMCEHTHINRTIK